MSNVPKISVVTPSFNQGSYLAATIESVLGQAGDFVLDYLVVDGASTDDSLAIIKRYDQLVRSGSFPVKCRGLSYRWLSEEDKGQGDALSKGFRLAQGELLAWLNSDDIYLPGALQTVTTFFREHSEVGLLYGEADYCDAAGAIVGRYRTEAFDYRKLAWFNFICQPAAFFRREVYDAVGGLDETLRFALDYDLWVRIGKRFDCRYLPEFLAMYRLHESSKTILDETLYQNCEEALRLARKHFGWVPLTRVYNSCHAYCRTRLPKFLAARKPAVVLATVACSVLRSLWLNRGIRRDDLRLFNADNLAKLFKTRVEIMTGKKER